MFNSLVLSQRCDDKTGWQEHTLANNDQLLQDTRHEGEGVVQGEARSCQPLDQQRPIFTQPC